MNDTLELRFPDEIDAGRKYMVAQEVSDKLHGWDVITDESINTMTKDLIEQAVDGWQDETERTATGVVDGHDIRVEKKEYQIEQRGPTAWKVAVYVDSDGPVATEQTKELNASEAQKIFDNLVTAHSLQV